jgi:hypothetical protein
MAEYLVLIYHVLWILVLLMWSGVAPPALAQLLLSV